MLAIQSPYPSFPDLQGAPLQAGKAYFGIAFENPLTDPVDVFWDAAGTQPATQPVRTVNGMLVRAGTPANVFCDGDYSTLIQDEDGRQVFYARSAQELSGLIAIQASLTALQADLAAGVYADTVRYVTNVLVADDAIGIQALAQANPGKRILNAKSATLNFFSKARLSNDGVWLDLNGGYIVQHTANIDSLEFSPPTAGVTSAFLNSCGLMNGTISHSSVAGASTSGGISLIQCNGFRVRDVTFNNADLRVLGGQLNRVSGCSFFASSGAYRGDGSACVHIMPAPYGAGLYQIPFTIDIMDWKGSATELRESIIRVHEGDGITIAGGGYGAFGLNSIVLFMASRLGGYFGACSVEGNYLDCVNPTTGTQRCIEFRDNAALGTDTVTLFGLKINDNWLGNGVQVGILGRKSHLGEINISDNELINFGSWAIDIDTLASASVVHLGGNRFGNNGDGSSGAVRVVGGGNSFDMAGNHLTSTANLCLQIGGAWQVGNVAGNTNGANVSDIALAAGTTFGAGMATPYMSGNASLYTGPLANSWVVNTMKISAFANDAAAAAGGIPLGGLYRIGNAVQIRLV